ncbi:hypothetical protein R3P38DRAFT_3379437 [Favolaschia claudopus]|uniref:Uncharacterized protein n=1 Tax=Favolaschia claudopus TaxID=2862362 RepID=A0AAV9Z6H0_9AGAR
MHLGTREGGNSWARAVPVRHEDWIWGRIAQVMLGYSYGRNVVIYEQGNAHLGRNLLALISLCRVGGLTWRAEGTMDQALKPFVPPEKIQRFRPIKIGGLTSSAAIPRHRGQHWLSQVASPQCEAEIQYIAVLSYRVVQKSVGFLQLMCTCVRGNESEVNIPSCRGVATDARKKMSDGRRETMQWLSRTGRSVKPAVWEK